MTKILDIIGDYIEHSIPIRILLEIGPKLCFGVPLYYLGLIQLKAGNNVEGLLWFILANQMWSLLSKDFLRKST